MLVPFLYDLRARGVPVGAQEAVALAGALARGLHGNSLSGFYHVARALVVHSEAHLDAFDEAFLARFRGVAREPARIRDEVLEWLREALERRPELSAQERAILEALGPEALQRLFEERLREQTERHDGGNRWIGTGGTSPFGRGGAAREGLRVGGPGGARSAIRVADARLYRPYRADLTLDVRQFAVALRKLREFAREGAERELDLEGSIDATARNAGELEVVTRPPRRPATRVLLLLDVGGSMEPYAQLVSRLFTAASRATHFRHLASYYFHNCVYGRLYRTERFDDPVAVPDLLQRLGRHYKLIVVGDALMAPYELLSARGSLHAEDESARPGVEWLGALAAHFDRGAWLNPEPPRTWTGNTIEVVRRLFPMFPLTLEGLGEAVGHLVRGRRRRTA
ncbi:MAG: VWA domain-containing protein [Planctomycetes bacterium]|nr:VWA domain-containing protein [Planctomycetota bacterium]